MGQVRLRDMEERWRERLEERGSPRSPLSDAAAGDDDSGDDTRPFYCLDMFPYPSRDGFSVNQLRGIAVSDVVVRYQAARGRTVFRPMGWDSFGRSIEEEAREAGILPQEVVTRGIEVMREQLRRFGAWIDWDHEVCTSEPEYYRWTQWLFRRLHQEGLVSRQETRVHWCSRCKMNLANEEVHNGCCVHCGDSAGERELAQWVVEITRFSDRLHLGLRNLKWPTRVKTMQRNWIGRREGYRLTLKVSHPFMGEWEEIDVFVRNLESVADCTFLVLSPEHPLIDSICDEFYFEEVEEYRKLICDPSNKSEVADGVVTGAHVLNPLTLKSMPIVVSSFVLPSVRFGAILANPKTHPLHSEFAERMGLPRVGGAIDAIGYPRRKWGRGRKRAQTEQGGDLKRRVRTSLEARDVIESHTLFNLRDWVFGRQRFWGEPIPVIHCESCGPVLVPEEDLPVLLPEIEPPTPSEEGGSALAEVESFINVPCPTCGSPARREGDVMAQWAASCWYYLRFLSPTDSTRIFDPEKGKEWLPVNLCVGGIEHSVLHLLYVRFFSYFFHDQGLTSREEPFRRVFSQGRIRLPRSPADKNEESHGGGRILAAEHLDRYGGDALRLHLLFMGPPVADIEWNGAGIRGCARFLMRVHEVLTSRVATGKFVSRRVLVEKHRLIRRVSRAIRTYRLNKAVSSFMSFIKLLRSDQISPEEVDRSTLSTFCILFQPFAPHMANELWERIGGEGRLADQPWPEYSEELLSPHEVEIAVMVDDKIVDRVVIDPELAKNQVIDLVTDLEAVKECTGGIPAARVIHVPGRLLKLLMAEEHRTPDESTVGPAASE